MSLKNDFMSIFPTRMDEMSLNPVTLQFKGRREQAYWDARITSEWGQKRIAIILTVVLYLVFGIADWLLVPEVKDLLWFIRFTFYIPAALIVFSVSYMSFSNKYIHYMVSALTVVSSIAHIMVFAQVPTDVMRLYGLGLILFLVLGTTLMRTKFVYATGSVVLSYIIFEIYLFIAKPLPINEVWTLTLVTFVGMLIALAIGYISDYITHRNYYMSIHTQKVTEEPSTHTRSSRQKAKTAPVEAKPEPKTVVRTIESPINRLFEQINDVVWFISLEGEIKYISSSIKEFLGYEPEDLIGKRAVTIMTNEAYASFDQKASRLYRDKNVVEERFEYKTKAGLIKFGESHVKRYSDKRLGEGYVGSTRPMNDEKMEAIEVDIQQQSKINDELVDLKNINAKLSNELEDLKHKIRRVHEEQDKRQEVPLNALAEALERVATHYADLTKEQIETLYKEVRLVEDKFKDQNMSKYDLENYFKITKRKLHETSNGLDVLADRVHLFNSYLMASDTLRIETYPMRSLLEESVLKLKHFFKDTKHIIEIKCQKGLEIDIDKSLFEQVINNMIINSLLFSFKGMRNGKIDIAVEVQDKQVIITYKDDGEKIQADVIDEMFAQIINHDINALEGLELHIVRQIIETHLKGTIGCEYDNQKNTFRMVLPLERE